MRATLILAALLLAGCDLNPTPLTNRQIVEQVKYCRENGMKGVQLADFTGRTVFVECRQ